MQCSIGLILKLSGGRFMEFQVVSSSLCRVKFRGFEVFRIKNIGGTALPILTQVTLLHETLRVLKWLPVNCGGKNHHF